ncbi:hypothetical protein P154DRAFT_102891 [Amniculicola lignicola CBS 123094]|uniref:Uncharacterized protein n=1 Tax=Amniculicola lignicola CBS 123094 TaxID=1392246 RepID=A0A6A5WW34_9PLEO|nr:hypothetical protein P154DRAFT_102891 [Amniculicola lignicola CBS 123094]
MYHVGCPLHHAVYWGLPAHDNGRVFSSQLSRPNTKMAPAERAISCSLTTDTLRCCYLQILCPSENSVSCSEATARAVCQIAFCRCAVSSQSIDMKTPLHRCRWVCNRSTARGVIREPTCDILKLFSRFSLTTVHNRIQDCNPPGPWPFSFGNGALHRDVHRLPEEKCLRSTVCETGTFHAGQPRMVQWDGSHATCGDCRVEVTKLEAVTLQRRKWQRVAGDGFVSSYDVKRWWFDETLDGYFPRELAPHDEASRRFVNGADDVQIAVRFLAPVLVSYAGSA